MRRLLGILYKEFLATIKSPKRILSIFNRNRLYAYFVEWKITLRESWNHYGTNQLFKKREYRTYKDYIAHQKAKLERIGPGFLPADYDVRYREVLRERLGKLNLLRHGTTVLCLAARIGTEVKSFLDIGCFAVGIDLNPGKNNRYVVYGDFLDIQFTSNSVDVIFTNSLDHVFDIEKLINEIKRILKPNGLLILEVARGNDEGGRFSFYESFSWTKIDNILTLFKNSQFRLINRLVFDYPWNGEQLCLEKEK